MHRTYGWLAWMRDIWIGQRVAQLAFTVEIGWPVGMHGQLCDPVGFVVLVHHIYMHSSVSEKFWFYEKFECTLVFFLLEV